MALGCPTVAGNHEPLEDVSSGRPVLASEDAVRPRLRGIGPATLVLCGHTHMPRVVQLPSNRVLTSYDTLVDHCCGAWNKLVGQPWTIMSIGLHDWAHGS